MQRRNFLFSMTGVLATAVVPSLAEAAAVWVYLGKRRVNPLLDHDLIHVGPVTDFHKIRLSVTGNGLFMYDLKVTYRNGVVDDIPVRWHIPQGGGTRIIDLRGNDRVIRNVQFWYGRPVNGKGATHIMLWGRS